MSTKTNICRPRHAQHTALGKHIVNCWHKVHVGESVQQQRSCQLKHIYKNAFILQGQHVASLFMGVASLLLVAIMKNETGQLYIWLRIPRLHKYFLIPNMGCIRTFLGQKSWHCKISRAYSYIVPRWLWNTDQMVPNTFIWKQCISKKPPYQENE